MHYFNGQQRVPITFARARNDLDAYFVCPGPSLARYRPSEYDDLFSARGAYVLACNTAYPTVRRPHAWVGMDEPHCYDRRLWFEAFPKFTEDVLAGHGIGGVALRDCPHVYFFAINKLGRSPEALLREREHNAEFSFCRNTFFTGLHLLIWMGFRRIHLVGSDMRVEHGAYHDERAIGALALDHNRKQMLDILQATQQLAILAAREGIEIVSCTEGSPLNSHMRWTPLEEAIELTERRTPIEQFERSRVINARELKSCAWVGAVKADEGVVVGCDREQEWLLPWWWNRYRRSNERPVVVANLGMSADARLWAEATFDDVIDVEASPTQFDECRAATRAASRIWFYKPSCILNAPFRKIVWCDLDVDVRGSLDPVFALVEDRCVVGAAECLLQRQPSATGTTLNGGLLGLMRGDPMIERWARYCFTRHAEFYGDQDVLNYVQWEHRGRAKLLPYGVCRLRLEGDDEPDVAAFHWTGEQGKAHIWLREVRDPLRVLFGAMWPAGEEVSYVEGGERNGDGNPHGVPLQRRDEFLSLLEIVRRHFAAPRVVEVGAYDGRQRPYWERLCNARYWSVDIDGRCSDLRGDSRSPDTVARMRRLLPDGRCDVLFIDGDHRAAALDHALWSPLVRPGGFVVWHDINLSYVAPQWERAKAAAWLKVWEIRSTTKPRTTCGIGVLRKHLRCNDEDWRLRRIDSKEAHSCSPSTGSVGSARAR